MIDETLICSLCGMLAARHFHIPDLQQRISDAPAESQRTYVVESRSIISIEIRVGAEDVVWVCDRCAPGYKADHPDFFVEP